MELADLIPYVFGTGAAALIGLALTWRRRDARDAIETANLNIDAAVQIREAALTDLREARSEVVALRARVSELEISKEESDNLAKSQGLKIGELQDEVESLKRRNAILRGERL